ncbi:hypothetical protein ABKN59_010925 [Abortiporus biennis]
MMAQSHPPGSTKRTSSSCHSTLKERLPTSTALSTSEHMRVSSLNSLRWYYYISLCVIRRSDLRSLGIHNLAPPILSRQHSTFQL